MKITLLGTGTSQGVPVIACSCDVCLSDNQKDKRLRSSVMIEVDGQTIVVDTGPDFRQQMLRESVQKVDAILFTHEHKDHIAGMDDVRAFNHKWKKDMEIFATERVGGALKREFHYVFSGHDYPGIPRVNINTISNTPFKVNETEIIPIEDPIKAAKNAAQKPTASERRVPHSNLLIRSRPRWSVPKIASVLKGVLNFNYK